MSCDDHASWQDPPEDAAIIFGERFTLACQYAEILSTKGIDRGLVGPRETSRIWERHLLNSVAIIPLIATDSCVVDIGTGAGLPGIPLAIARPDLRITLVEPLLRRVTFLQEIIRDLHLPITLIRGKAESHLVRESVVDYDIAVSRAVTSLDKLTQWSFPLLKINGMMIAIKGQRAQIELDEHRFRLKQLGAIGMKVIHCQQGVSSCATVIVATRKK